MKHTSLFTAFILTLLLSNSIQASQDKLYTAKKYPYNLLLSRTDTVKIIYSENKEKVDCKVEINWENEMITSKQTRVSKRDFINEPLASCLPRENAKNILAKTFE
ncbi:MAG: hypothetical protein MJK12_00310 [Colwellia sp.]|nr:hypothetical protein [Colwellia sp.]